MALMDGLPPKGAGYARTNYKGIFVLSAPSPYTPSHGGTTADPPDLIHVFTEFVGDHTGNLGDLQASMEIPVGPGGVGFRKINLLIEWEIPEVFEGMEARFNNKKLDNSGYIWQIIDSMDALKQSIDMWMPATTLAYYNTWRGSTFTTGLIALSGDICSSIIPVAQMQFWFV